MLLRHATPARNLASIQRLGLLTSYSKGKMPAVWLCSPNATSWATLHVVKRHGGRIEGVVVVEVDVPRTWLRRSKRRLYFCPRDIPPQRFKRVWTFQEVAGASVEP